ncbi:conserved hypothetical protein [Talaromyces stipitatus ATCC 10500]|uniref:Casein kinase II beta 2 subunit n=1 Tax=Talaromyces stipitatus (strain ATCC 10500 / CBS 375.48 / QM 6759 / NRRL 1006) TaxID=441959 RepID=B8LUV7_TALSN|nr:uncharacterized protein TSTA_074290 [Talaromyces stipitatus ATCC 10500]EED24049.1 conserved hypothetical protein [Talaromyces stipitatus ATCC 10500]
MAPASGHLLLPKIWRAARFAYEKAARALKAKLSEQSQQLQPKLQPAYAHVGSRQPISRAAAIRQAQSRRFSTRAGGYIGSHLRQISRPAGSATPNSSVRQMVIRLTSQSPFNSALRPNLTGGTLGRTAGGYSIGAGRIGGARYFSHGPAAPAQVIQNVSVAMRGFWLSGQRARFDGIDPCTGEKRFKTVTPLQDKAQRRMVEVSRNTPGSYIDFQLSPTITSIGNLKNESLQSEGLMEMLSVDFARALKDLAAVLNDLQRLGTLGDLPVSLENKSTLRVRFPGCDAEQVERLCDEVGVERGQVYQDEDFDHRTGAELALLFPFAPSIAPTPEAELLIIHENPRASTKHDLDWRLMMSGKTSPRISHDTNQISFEDVEMFGDNPWISSPSGYSSIGVSELGDREFFAELSPPRAGESHSDYEGVQGIYKFLEQCDLAAGQRF